MRISDQAKVEAYKQLKPQNDKVKNEKKVPEDEENVLIKDEAIKDKGTLLTPEDQISIESLKAESEKAYANLRRIVEDMLRRQGIEVEKLDSFTEEEFKNIKVDEQAREEAKQMIEGDGPLSPEKVSDRIVDFAKAISGGNKEKLSLLREAIEAGFDAAEEHFGELPEISTKTHDLITEKLDAWENEQ